MQKIRTVIIGVGYRGGYLLELMRSIDLFEVVAVADPSDDLLARVSRLYEDGGSSPVLYCNGVDDYRRMLADHLPDLVVIASPWEFHLVQAVASLEVGAHVALEIKGALRSEEYDDLIRLSKVSGLKIFPLENVFFKREILSVYNMVQAGVLGEIVFCQGGYRHDLRKLLVDGLGNFGVTEHPESVWRSPFYEQFNGDLYPTHGIAPLCMMLGVNRVDRFAEFTAFATKGVGIHSAIRLNGGDSHPDLDRSFAMGDVITSIIKTERGAQITLLHDTTLPRPRSLNFEVQGSLGIWNGDRRCVYISGVSPFEEWEDDEKYILQYEHSFWTRWGADALRLDVHHQGMDYIMLRVLAEDFFLSGVYPFDIKDLSVWASVTPLSLLSIAEGRTIGLL